MVPERDPLPVRDLSAGAAELEHQPEHLRVDEGIVLADGRDLAIALGLIGVFAEPDLPLRAVHVVAEEVWRRVDIGRLLRAGGGVDEGQLRMGLGKILDRDAFVAGERREQDLDLVLFDQLAHGANRGVGRRIRRGDDELEFLVADLLAEHVERSLVTANAVFTEHRVGAFQGRGDTNLDLLLRELQSPKATGCSTQSVPNCPSTLPPPCFANLFCGRSQRCDRALWTSQES